MPLRNFTRANNGGINCSADLEKMPLPGYVNNYGQVLEHKPKA
jgi:hypothetical protein